MHQFFPVTGIEIDRLFLKLDPGTVVEVFTKMILFPAENLIFRQKPVKVPGSVLEIKRF
jgi:hypothetical protein